MINNINSAYNIIILTINEIFLIEVRVYVSCIVRDCIHVYAHMYILCTYTYTHTHSITITSVCEVIIF